MSPYLYRHLMREQRARLRQHAGAPRSDRAHEAVIARAQPGRPVRPPFMRQTGAPS
jgi:hypothetical protein